MADLVEFHPFTQQDWYGWAGAEAFPNGDQPLMATSNFGVLIVDANGIAIEILNENGDDYLDGGYYWDWKMSVPNAKDAAVIATGVRFLFSTAESCADLREIVEDMEIFKKC